MRDRAAVMEYVVEPGAFLIAFLPSYTAQHYQALTQQIMEAKDLWRREQICEAPAYV